MKHFLIAAVAAALTGAALAQTTAPAPKQQVAQADVDTTFGRLDANKDGGVDKGEAGAMKGLAEIFDRVDTNRDGKLDKTEFAAALGMLK
jgi:ABC-type transporter MlaC component